MNKYFSLVAICSLLAATNATLSGCSTIHAQSRIDPRTIAIYDTSALKSKDYEDQCFSGKLFMDANRGALNLDCAKFPEQKDKNSKTAYALATADAASRNRLAQILITQSDNACLASLGRAANNQALSNLILNFMTTALSTASTVVVGETAKSILSGGAAVSSGTKDHMNADLFRHDVVTAITKAIHIRRAELRAAIETRLRSDDIATYNVDAMISEVNRYHQECSYIRGLELMVKAVEEQAPSGKERVAAKKAAIDALTANIETAKAAGVSEGDLGMLRGKLVRMVSDHANAAASLSKDGGEAE